MEQSPFLMQDPVDHEIITVYAGIILKSGSFLYEVYFLL